MRSIRRAEITRDKTPMIMRLLPVNSSLPATMTMGPYMLPSSTSMRAASTSATMAAPGFWRM